MNQDQRKFLLAQVESTFRKQQSKIEEKKPNKPNLNNYIVAAFLDNSIEFADIIKLKQKIRERVLKMGKGDVLVQSESSYRRHEEKDMINLDADDLFIIPEGYQRALAEYNAAKESVEAELETLDANKNTILLKIQIGSNEVLDKLITQVDNLADLSIMNSQLLLGTQEESKKQLKQKNE